MNVSLWISRRLRLGTSDGSNAGVAIAVAGVALSLIIMEFTLAIVVGFKDGIRDKLMGFDAQITVLPPVSNHGDSKHDILELTPQLSEIVTSTLPDAETRLVMRQPGLLKTDDNFQGAVYLGQQPNADFSFEKSLVTTGEWPDFASDSSRNDIVISEQTAAKLNLHPGDKVYSTFFVSDALKMRRHRIAALYSSNFGEYDNTIIFASLAGLQSVAGIDSLGGNRLDIRGAQLGDIELAAAELQGALLQEAANGTLDAYYPVTNIKKTGAVYFNWLSLLDTNVIIILLLMLCVAGLTLVSSLFIIILERIRTIGILRAMGADKSTVRRIFVDITMRLVGRGMIIGNVTGIGLLLIQKYTHVIPLNPEMYYLSSVPVQINVVWFILLNIGTALFSWLILIGPARLASNIDPAKAMNYD